MKKGLCPFGGGSGNNEGLVETDFRLALSFQGMTNP